MTRSTAVIGVDFDNTIADYDDLMYNIGVERGLVQPGFIRSKRLIRDAIRALPDGETHWRGLQVTAYGLRMHEARLIEGVRDFFLQCRRRRIPVYIVSHKTEYANFGDALVNLRDAASAWLDKHGFFDESEIGLRREHVFFETTRLDKIARIRQLGITHFIDDLEETFGEESFPSEVDKILFAPHRQLTRLRDAVSLTTWGQITDRVLSTVDREILAALTGSPVRAVERIGRGGNSKVYRVDCADGRSYAAKFYFQRTMDELDRLDVEFTSLQFLWQNGERSIPQPLALDRARQIAVYEFVPGEPIDSRDVSIKDIEEIVAFAARLKKLSAVPNSDRLPRAAEACFSFEEFDAIIRGRLTRLESVRGETPSHLELRSFLNGELRDALESSVRNVRDRVGRAGWSAQLAPSARTLSPSDFGFHNALRSPDGSLRLLDLEYFGWDDPAKLIADFVLHPGMDLNDEVKAAYVDGLLKAFADDAQLIERLGLLFPLFAIKWCEIILNEFVPDFLERREFAVRGTVDREVVRMRQLAKARKMLSAGRDQLHLLLPS
ncbi:MAG TPA: hypothetical protein VMP10_04250 [Chloroflexota bacterium]|nr:hypothetical protein [Chloroflexota bacterium]